MPPSGCKCPVLAKSLKVRQTVRQTLQKKKIVKNSGSVVERGVSIQSTFQTKQTIKPLLKIDPLPLFFFPLKQRENNTGNLENMNF